MEHDVRGLALGHNQIRTEIVTNYEQLLHAYAVRSICFMEEHGISKLTVRLLTSEEIRWAAVDDSDSG